jgi:hypothetical protein
VQQDGQTISAVRDYANEQWVFNLVSAGQVDLPIVSSAEYEILGSTNIVHEEFGVEDGHLIWNAELDDTNEAGSMQVKFANWGLVLFNVPAQP